MTMQNEHQEARPLGLLYICTTCMKTMRSFNGSRQKCCGTVLASKELDEKPKRTDFPAFAKGHGIAPSINFNCPCTTAPLKETKMIDLSTAKVGDKFVSNNGTIVTFFARTLMNSICTLDSGHAMVYHHNGKFDESVEPNDDKNNWHIVSKHDPRTDEEKSIEDLAEEIGNYDECQRSCYKNEAKHLFDKIKAGEVHGVKWVGVGSNN